MSTQTFKHHQLIVIKRSIEILPLLPLLQTLHLLLVVVFDILLRSSNLLLCHIRRHFLTRRHFQHLLPIPCGFVALWRLWLVFWLELTEPTPHLLHFFQTANTSPWKFTLSNAHFTSTLQKNYSLNISSSMLMHHPSPKCPMHFLCNWKKEKRQQTSINLKKKSEFDFWTK